MKLGICNSPIVKIYEKPGALSGVTDEMLYGWACRIMGEERDFYQIVTHYGYEGYVRKEDIVLIQHHDLTEREESEETKFVKRSAIDILTVPRVQGRILTTVYRGSLICVPKQPEGLDGWCRVILADGRSGYTRCIYLNDRLDTDLFLLAETKQEREKALESQMMLQRIVKEEKEGQFREAVVDTAKAYMSVQYRWGGKSFQGIDCSGLAFMSYYENGILIYRDAFIKEGFPVHQIPIEKVQKGDLLYFPGHVAIYIGEGAYLHATGHQGSAGVTTNSLRRQDQDFRQDLSEKLLAAGSIF